MLNEEYDREFILDVNQYLIDNYKMTLPRKEYMCSNV